MNVAEIAEQIFIRMAADHQGKGAKFSEIPPKLEAHLAAVAFKYAEAFVAERDKRPSKATVKPLRT